MTSDDSVSEPRRGRSVPVVYGMASTILIVIAAAVALVAPPPRTPPLAAVAPAPREQIAVERVEQSSRFGDGRTRGDGDCDDESCASGSSAEDKEPDWADPPSAPTVTERPGGGQYRRCHNRGQTQSPDPQSPACIAEIFAGDNGGATSRGVTGTEVRVAVLMRLENEDSTSLIPLFEALEQHFNRYYEFWGRRLVLELVDVEGRALSKPEDARAIANEVLALAPFASLEYPTGWRPEYAQTLARNGVIVTLGRGGHPLAGASQQFLTSPYVWSVLPQFDESMRALGDLTCTALVDRPAQHAGDAALQRMTRRFGVLVQSEQGHRFTPDAFTAALDGCGAPYDTYDVDDDDPATFEAAIATMSSNGTTTVVCSCSRLDDDFTQAAERNTWRPEWLQPTAAGAGDGQTVVYGNNHPDAQLALQFGLHGGLRMPSREAGFTRQHFEEQYWYEAVREQDPSYEYGSYDSADELYGHYAQLLILASGIQAAGPDLTATSFATALENSRFPNPGIGVAPWYQPAAGFAPGDHVLNSDYSLWWFEASAVNSGDNRTVRNRNKGRFCYLGDGVRFVPGAWPTDADDRFFDPEAGCR